MSRIILEFFGELSLFLAPSYGARGQRPQSQRQHDIPLSLQRKFYLYFDHLRGEAFISPIIVASSSRRYQSKNLQDLFDSIITNPAEWTPDGLLKLRRKVDPNGPQHSCKVGCSPNMCKGEFEVDRLA